jgi:small subunit ribosomal protein S9
MSAASKYFYAVGRRKSAVAQVRLFLETGASFINGKAFDSYVTRSDLFSTLLAPAKLSSMQDKIRFEAKVEGGGESAQAEAIRHGLARALVLTSADLKPILRGAGFLTRDARKVERKKPGLHKARKASQWSKR